MKTSFCLHARMQAVLCFHGLAWLCFCHTAMSHADRLANARRSLSSEGDDAVAAFAVYVRKCLQPLVSELTAVVNIFVRAWLIASRIVYMYIFNRFFAVKN